MTIAGGGEETTKQGLDLPDFVRILRTYWLGATVIVLVGVAVAGAWTLTQPRVWASTASGFVQTTGSSDAGLALAAETLSKAKAKTYVELARSQAVADDVARKLDDGRSSAALLSLIGPTLAEDSTIIGVTARGSDANAAQTLADAWIASMVTQVSKIENPEGKLAAGGTTFVPLAAATQPATPISPDIPAALAVGAIGGIIAAGIFLFVRNSLDRRIRSSQMVEQITGTAVLGALIEFKGIGERRRIADLATPLTGPDRGTHFAVSEGLRELRTNLSYVNVDDPPRSFVVVSAIPGEGKSTVAANLAETIAMSGRRVVLIDCDLRRPMQAKIFNSENSAGLTDVLSGRAAIADVAQPVPGRPELFIIAAGPLPPNPSELLGSQTMHDMIRTITDSGMMVVVDAPPVLAVTDGAVLSTVVDGTLVVVDTGRTKKDQLARMTAAVRKVGGHLVGVVLNRVPERGPDSGAYGYYRSTYYYSKHDPVRRSKGTTPADITPLPSASAARRSRRTDVTERGA